MSTVNVMNKEQSVISVNSKLYDFKPSWVGACRECDLLECFNNRRNTNKNDSIQCENACCMATTRRDQQGGFWKLTSSALKRPKPYKQSKEDIEACNMLL